MVIRYTKKQKKFMSHKKKKELENRKGKKVPLSMFFKQPKTGENRGKQENPLSKVPKEMKVSGQEKSKNKADIRNSIKINAQIQILNGEHCIRYSNVPTILLDMKPPIDYHAKTQNQRFAMWFKLEDKEYMNVAKQLKPHLKELTFWFEKEDEEKLREFLKESHIF